MMDFLTEKILLIHSEQPVGQNRLLVDVTTEEYSRRVRKRRFVYAGTWETVKERGYF